MTGFRNICLQNLNFQSCFNFLHDHAPEDDVLGVDGELGVGLGQGEGDQDQGGGGGRLSSE